MKHKKIHLGCGQVYLEGYLNIDYPSTNHTVQLKSKADLETDLLTLKYKNDSISEVRLHHVFEHFQRAHALALIVVWRKWLIPGGLLRIEVPDFNRTALNILNPLLSFNQKSVALRHVFGSNEAQWAVHYEGWSKDRFERILALLGFEIDKIKFNNWKGTYNIEVFAKKTQQQFTFVNTRKIVSNYLKEYLIDNSASEKKLHKVWLNQFDEQIKKSQKNK